MGNPTTLKVYRTPRSTGSVPPPLRITKSRPRDYVEWKTLQRWGKLPLWEPEPVGYLLRLAREEAGLSQKKLAGRLGCSQQAIAQAERWESNPTAAFLRRWAAACGRRLTLRLE